MKIVVTHSSPDLDAITSVWLIKKFLPNWENASVQFVPAGERLNGRLPHVASDARSSSFSNQSNTRSLNERLSSSSNIKPTKNVTAFNSLASEQAPVIEVSGADEVIHVDTGMGPLDHHQTASDEVCAASRTFEYVMKILEENGQNLTKEKKEALERMVKVVVDVDHFKEVFWEDATADYHEFSFINVLDGFRLMRPNEDSYYVVLGMEYLDAVLHEFENRIWAEREIRENGKKFETRFGKGIGFETINDSVIKLAQKMGYVVVVRKDPRKGYVRVKARPSGRLVNQRSASSYSPAGELNARRLTLDADIDLTLVCEKLKKMDPAATWYLHVSKKMLLNGSVKNPKMRPTKLTLDEIIKVLTQI